MDYAMAVHFQGSVSRGARSRTDQSDLDAPKNASRRRRRIVQLPSSSQFRYRSVPGTAVAARPAAPVLDQLSCRLRR